jgi:hypothetical protein
MSKSMRGFERGIRQLASAEKDVLQGDVFSAFGVFTTFRRVFLIRRNCRANSPSETQQQIPKIRPLASKAIYFFLIG